MIRSAPAWRSQTATSRIRRRLVFELEADDGVEVISRGRHERFVIDRARFVERVARKRAAAAAPGGSL